MEKAAPDLPNGLDEEEKLEDVKISCAHGSEYEIQHIVPPHLEKYRIAHAIPYYYFGYWGCALFQKIRGEIGNAWDNRTFPDHDITISAVYPRPLTEMYASISDSFECIFNGTPVPAGRARQGGVMHARGFHNTSILKAGREYHSHDVHMFPGKLEKFSNDHPHLYDLLNNAAQKKAGMIPKILTIDGELGMLIHQLKNPSCAPGLIGDFAGGKITEYLMSAFWQIDRKDPHKPIVISQAEIDKAIAAEIYMREHLKEYINTLMLAAKFHTNIRYLQIAFKQHFKTTIMVYLRKLRMSKAKIDLLEKPKESIDSICLDVGYSSRTDFSKAFRKEVGCLPSEFRRAAGIKGNE